MPAKTIFACSEGSSNRNKVLLPTVNDSMESSPKRRKTSGGEKQDVAFDGRLATASRFVLEAEELLKEVRVDYGKTGFGSYADVNSAVFKVREAIESIEGHEGIPVSHVPWVLPERPLGTSTDKRRSGKRRSACRRRRSGFPIPTRSPRPMRPTNSLTRSRASTMSSAATCRGRWPSRSLDTASTW